MPWASSPLDTARPQPTHRELLIRDRCRHSPHYPTDTTILCSVSDRHANPRWPSRLPARSLAKDAIDWDIEAEHLEEAAFMLELREVNLDMPNYHLDTLERGPERRLFDHLEGLRRGGPLVIERILRPAVENPDGEALDIAAACLASLPGADHESHERLFALLGSETSETQRAGARRALQLGVEPKTDALLTAKLQDRITARLEAQDELGLSAMLDILFHRGATPGPWLASLLVRSHPELVRAAAQLARQARDTQTLAALGPLAQAEDPLVSRAALETALIHGMRGAWDAALYWAFTTNESPSRREALLWVGCLGDAAEHDRLFALFDHSELRRDALWAASYCGRVAAVDRCMATLDDPELGPRAGEVVVAITGLPTTDDRYWFDRPQPDEDESLPPLDADDLEADLTPNPEARLPLPEPGEVRRWWEEARPRFDPARRYLGGSAVDGSTLLHALAHGPLRRRHALAFEVAVRSRGLVQLDTRAWCWRQRAQLSGIDVTDLRVWRR